MEGDITKYKNQEIVEVNHPQLGIVFVEAGKTTIHPTLDKAQGWIDWKEKKDDCLLKLFGRQHFSELY